MVSAQYAKLKSSVTEKRTAVEWFERLFAATEAPQDKAFLERFLIRAKDLARRSEIELEQYELTCEGGRIALIAPEQAEARMAQLKEEIARFDQEEPAWRKEMVPAIARFREKYGLGSDSQTQRLAAETAPGDGPAHEPVVSQARIEPAERTPRDLVEAYKAEVREKKDIELSDADIWRKSRYKTRSSFERWLRQDPKRPNNRADEVFRRLLTETKPHLK